MDIKIDITLHSLYYTGIELLQQGDVCWLHDQIHSVEIKSYLYASIFLPKG